MKTVENLGDGVTITNYPDGWFEISIDMKQEVTKTITVKSSQDFTRYKLQIETPGQVSGKEYVINKCDPVLKKEGLIQLSKALISFLDLEDVVCLNLQEKDLRKCYHLVEEFEKQYKMIISDNITRPNPPRISKDHQQKCDINVYLKNGNVFSYTVTSAIEAGEHAEKIWSTGFRTKIGDRTEWFGPHYIDKITWTNDNTQNNE